MIDFNSTIFDWQRHETTSCVWPVGDLEQHAHHMPLRTDNIIAEHFARMLAEELDAALMLVGPLTVAQKGNE
ncbi:MAG: creatininase family protein [Pirellulaceae bacterium]